METPTTVDVESQQSIYIERNDVRICDTNILSDLCNEAGNVSNDVRNCLSIYRLNTPTKQLKSMFNQCKKALIVQTLIFLNATDCNWDDYTRDACLHELICKIQNLLIDKCQFCDQHYATLKDEAPLLKCSLCGQGVHSKCLKELLGEEYSDEMTADDVLKLINPFNEILSIQLVFYHNLLK